VHRDKLIEELFSLSPKVKESGVWTNLDGDKIKIEDMSTHYIKNVVGFLKKMIETRRKNAEEAENALFNSCFSMYENPYSMYPDEQEHWDTYEHDDWGDRD
jgi:hypothetical protein